MLAIPIPTIPHFDLSKINRLVRLVVISLAEVTEDTRRSSVPAVLMLTETE